MDNWAKGSYSLMGGTIGTIGANGSAQWNKWMFHWRIAIEWFHWIQYNGSNGRQWQLGPLLAPLTSSPSAPMEHPFVPLNGSIGAPLTKLFDPFTDLRLTYGEGWGEAQFFR